MANNRCRSTGWDLGSAIVSTVWLLVVLLAAGCKETTEPDYLVTFDPTKFVTTINNPYMPLVPGTQFFYQGVKDGRPETNTVTVSNQTKVILGVTCVVVHDSVFVDGKIEEATIDWFAQDQAGNVWYMGEDSKDFENGVVVSTAGSWEAGVQGAEPGIAMPAQPAVGQTYRQEFLVGEAEDHAHVLGLQATVTVPQGTYSGCLQTEEWTPVEPGFVEYKWYASGIGLLQATALIGGEEDTKLVSVTAPVGEPR